MKNGRESTGHVSGMIWLGPDPLDGIMEVGIKLVRRALSHREEHLPPYYSSVIYFSH